MKYLALCVLIFGFVCLIAVSVQAGTTPSGAAAGTVAAIILCEEEGSVSVDHSQVTINSDTCSCSAYDEGNEDLGCGADVEDSCAACLANLQRGGMTIVDGNGYFDTGGEKKQHYLLTGLANTFLARVGCFCD